MENSRGNYWAESRLFPVENFDLKKKLTSRQVQCSSRCVNTNAFVTKLLETMHWKRMVGERRKQVPLFMMKTTCCSLHFFLPVKGIVKNKVFFRKVKRQKIVYRFSKVKLCYDLWGFGHQTWMRPERGLQIWTEGKSQKVENIEFLLLCFLWKAKELALKTLDNIHYIFSWNIAIWTNICFRICVSLSPSEAY